MFTIDQTNPSSDVLVRVYDCNNQLKHSTWVDVGTPIKNNHELLTLLQAVSWDFHCEDPYLIENELGFKGSIKAVRKIGKMLRKRDMDDVHAWAQWTWSDTGVHDDKTIIDIRQIDYSRRWKHWKKAEELLEHVI